ncbi:MAG: undecaprenyl-diphosphate phosphatase [Burkholderiales bacterium]|nr:undecaprenyl-diphosphate phosphatase [Burkholderiales bacterium]
MTLDAFLQAAILGIVEGFTEFLPISSTGHLIVVASLLDFSGNNGMTFFIAIQLGAILAVCWEYRKRLVDIMMTFLVNGDSRRLVFNLLIATLPAGVIGLLIKDFLERHLYSAIPVACALIVGAFVIFWAERRYRNRPQQIRIHSLNDIGWQDALKVGLAQCLAMIPGTSRSGATIIGAMFFGFSRVAATEFSFFLAIPVMFAATAYSIYDVSVPLNRAEWLALGVGFITSFIFAFLCVRWLLRYISRHDFTLFAWYRLGFGLFILVTSEYGWIRW